MAEAKSTVALFSSPKLFTNAAARLGLNKKPKFKTEPINEGGIHIVNTDHCPKRESYEKIHKPGSSSFLGFLELVKLRTSGPWGPDDHSGVGTGLSLDRDNKKPLSLTEMLKCRDQLRILCPWIRFKRPPLKLEDLFELVRQPEWVRLTITQDFADLGFGALHFVSETISEGCILGMATYQLTIAPYVKGEPPIVTQCAWPCERYPSADKLQQRFNEEDTPLKEKGKLDNEKPPEPRIKVKLLTTLKESLAALQKAEGEGPITYRFDLTGFSKDEKDKAAPADDAEPSDEDQAKAESDKAESDAKKREAANNDGANLDDTEIMVGGTITG